MSSHDFGSLLGVHVILGEFCTLSDLCRTAVAGRCLRSLMQGCQGSTYEAWPQVASSGLKLLRPVHIATARAMKQSQRKQSTLICAPLTFDLFVMWTSLTTLGPKRSTYSCVGFKLASKCVSSCLCSCGPKRRQEQMEQPQHQQICTCTRVLMGT